MGVVQEISKYESSKLSKRVGNLTNNITENRKKKENIKLHLDSRQQMREQ